MKNYKYIVLNNFLKYDIIKCYIIILYNEQQVNKYFLTYCAIFKINYIIWNEKKKIITFITVAIYK